MTVVVAHGAMSDDMMAHWLSENGVRRPYTLVTMDQSWYDQAGKEGVPRLFFTDKLKMMRFCLGKRIVTVMANDGSDEACGMIASFHALGAAVEFVVAT
jgi:hypothetical protein